MTIAFCTPDGEIKDERNYDFDGRKVYYETKLNQLHISTNKDFIGIGILKFLPGEIVFVS